MTSEQAAAALKVELAADDARLTAQGAVTASCLGWKATGSDDFCASFTCRIAAFQE